MKLKNNHNDRKVQDREADLENTIRALGKKQYRITQLKRKLEQQESLVENLRTKVDSKQGEIDTYQDRTQALQNKYNALRAQCGLKDEISSNSDRAQRQDQNNNNVG